MFVNTLMVSLGINFLYFFVNYSTHLFDYGPILSIDYLFPVRFVNFSYVELKGIIETLALRN